MGRATFALVINQTESKAKTPSVDNGFLVPGYPSSKLRAEKIVLAAYGATLGNRVGKDKSISFKVYIFGYMFWKFSTIFGTMNVLASYLKIFTFYIIEQLEPCVQRI